MNKALSVSDGDSNKSYSSVRLKHRRYDIYSNAMLQLLKVRADTVAKLKRENGLSEDNAALNQVDSDVLKLLDKVLKDTVLSAPQKNDISSWLLRANLDARSKHSKEIEGRIDASFDSILPCDAVPFHRLTERERSTTEMDDEVKDVSCGELV